MNKFPPILEIKEIQIMTEDGSLVARIIEEVIVVQSGYKIHTVAKESITE